MPLIACHPHTCCVHRVHHIDLGLPVSEAKYALAHMASWVKPTSVPTPLLVMPASSQVTPDPRGVILIIAPWNYPVSLVLNPLVAAIAAGNAVVIKPSEVSEHTSALLASLIPKYMDTDAIKVVEGAVPETQVGLGVRARDCHCMVWVCVY